VHFCGSGAVNQAQACRSACVPYQGAAASSDDCCANLARNSLGWCDQTCHPTGGTCSSNYDCCSLQCSPSTRHCL
jgi:hypothetical protein